ncbi:MAG TPA: hypothetical protein VNH46_09870 [Gemmatimonadales bacterium]|nr:hypothetical protein [Gemmatimonadales bacterium]
MTPRLPFRTLLAGALAASGLAACRRGEVSRVILPPGGLAVDSTGAIPRRFVDSSLVLEASFGDATGRDTLLLQPVQLAARDDRIFLFEADQRIVCFDRSGRLLWTQGRPGGGPGEYRNVRDMRLGPDGNLWVLDPASARVTVVDPGGRVTRMVPTQGVGHSEVAVPVTDGIALVPAHAEQDIEYLSTQGAPMASDSLPWADYRALEYVAKAHRAAVDPVTGHWVLGFSYGNGWFAFGASPGTASQRRFYIEPTRFPAVVQTVYDEGRAVGTGIVKPEFSALDLALLRDTLYVLFIGKGPAAGRQVDRYAWSSGHYLGSLQLPVEADYLAVTDHHLVLLTNHPLPRVLVFRRGPAADPGSGTAAADQPGPAGATR